MRTIFVVLMLPAAAGVVLYGFCALRLIVVGIFGGIVCELIACYFRRDHQPGSVSHGATMGLLVALMLPVNLDWYVPLVGAAAAVVIGKHIFGGLGQYVWHPGLVGWIVVQLFFSGQFDSTGGAVLCREKLLVGNAATVTETAQWWNFDWFEVSAPAETDGFKLPSPSMALRDFSGMRFEGTRPILDSYLTEHLPSPGHIVVGAVPGGIGLTFLPAILLVGLYLIYRGYLHWPGPLAFLFFAYLSSMVLPIPLEHPELGKISLALPGISQRLPIGLTYANYQLATGGLFFAAFILFADMSARPITLGGQMLFGSCAGVLTMLLRLYSPIAMPAFAAFLAMGLLIPSIDRLTRPSGRQPS